MPHEMEDLVPALGKRPTQILRPPTLQHRDSDLPGPLHALPLPLQIQNLESRGTRRDHKHPERKTKRDPFRGPREVEMSDQGIERIQAWKPADPLIKADFPRKPCAPGHTRPAA